MTEDGSIVINTKIRTDGIKAGTAEIEAGVHRAADRVNTLGSNVKKTLNNQIDSFVKLNDEYSTQEQKVESLRQKVAAYANQRIPTTEYKEITAQIEQAQEKLNRLNDAKERFGATGGKVNSTSLGITEDTNTWSGWKKLGYEVIHGSRALFGCSLIWGSKGDGVVYNAWFFGKSQVQAIV